MLIKKFKFAVAAVILSSGVSAYASEANEEESYHLSQMRALSQISSPEQTVPAKESNDLMAGTDLKTLAKQDNGLSDIKNIKPEFKPTLSDMKPKL